MTKISHLHVHSDFSALDGLGKVEAYAAKAARLGQPALGITDHGVLSGAAEHYWACRAAGIEPILGIEAYLVDDAARVKETKERDRYHLTLLAAGARGFEVLCDMSSTSYEQFYYKPLFDFPLLESLGKDAKHIVVLSGCAGSPISQAILKDKPQESFELARRWKGLFPNFYIEVMHHRTDFDRKLNKGLLDIAKKLDLPWVVTNDCHYVDLKQAEHHDALLCVQTKANIDDVDRFRFSGGGYHLRSYDAMAKAFAKYPAEVFKQGARNTLEIAKKCQTHIPAFESRSWRIPSYGIDKPQKFLALKVAGGLKRYSDRPEYQERAERELKAIEKVDMANFLLITAECADWARKQGARIGPGRGSVCGSLVAYLIGIHSVDPIKYDLLFERFLNVERPKMPDIDMDFPPSFREKMVEHVRELYGADNVMHVATFGTMKTKSAFQGLAKSHGIPYPEAMRLSAEIADEEGEVTLPDEVMRRFPDLAEQLKTLTGVRRQVGQHPAGIIIFPPDDDIKKTIPRMRVERTNRLVAAFDLNSTEKIGLMKQDFLGLRTLETIDHCLEIIKEIRGIDVDVDSWVPDEEDDDVGVYAMLAAGKVQGVFQMEGSSNARGIQQIKCENFESIVACTSLYRAGPITAGAPTRYLRNKRDGKVVVADPSLEPYLSNSWGELIYQEQMMSILHNLAGLSMSEVDEIKEIVRHKSAEMMKAVRAKVVRGFISHGICKESASDIWKMIASQSLYLFNRSHAVAYSTITYITARLKYLYPLEFITALVRTVEDADKRASYLQEAMELGFKILPPDARRKSPFANAEENAIRFGIRDVKGIGEAVCNRLAAAHETGSLKTAEDVAQVVNNTGYYKALVDVGALEGFGIKGDKNKAEQLLGWQFEDRMVKFRKRFENTVKLPSSINGERVLIIGEVVKITARKTKDNRPFRIWKIRWNPSMYFDVCVWDSAAELWSQIHVGDIIKVKGRWVNKGYFSSLGVSDLTQVKVVSSIHAA